MSSSNGPGVEFLERLLKREQQTVRPGERCDLCAVDIPDEHQHLVDLKERSLACACRGCYLLFDNPGAGGGRYRAVPDRYYSLPGVTITKGEWEALQIPVGVAFFFRNSIQDRTVAFYPGPAGATESLLPLDRWEELVADHPELDGLADDVEAVLVRADGDGCETFIVPIDACYELVGHLRRLWRGFDGGREAHDHLDSFFAGVRARARPLHRPESSHG